MITIAFALLLLLPGAGSSNLCDVLAWESRGPGEDAMVCFLNYQEIGRGDMGLEKCLAAIEKSPAQHLVILYGPFGPTPVTENQALLNRFHKLRNSRGATCIHFWAKLHPAVVFLQQDAGRLGVFINGKAANVPIPDLGKVSDVVKAKESGAAVVAIVSATILSGDKILEEDVRTACLFLEEANPSFVRIDLPASRKSQ